MPLGEYFLSFLHYNILQCLHDIISMTTITIQNLTAIKETLQWPLRGAERNSIDAKES